MHQALQPYTLAGMQLRNRIVRSATVDPLGASDGMVTDEQIAYYKSLADNQVGLIITGMANVSIDGAGAPTQNGIFDDRFISRHLILTNAVHDANGKVIMQINHAGAKSLHEMPPSPSGIPDPYIKAPCREMTTDEIHSITADFAAAAVRAKKAGYDGVQLHCAHGYLLSQFINPYFNKRGDHYGGNIENRFRFSCEVIESVKAAVGSDYPIMIKINSNIEECDESFEGELLWIGARCKELGIIAIEVSGFDFTPLGKSGNHNYYLERAAAVRRASGLPVILVGGIRATADMDTVLDAGVDMVSMSRPFICEPDIVKKMLNGQEASKCVSCSKCFVLGLKYKTEGIRCILHKTS